MDFLYKRTYTFERIVGYYSQKKHRFNNIILFNVYMSMFYA